MFTQPQAFYKIVSDNFLAMPKTPAELTTMMEKMKSVYTTESAKVAEVVEIYKKAATGDASPNEITIANKKAQNLMVTARFATLMTVPGAIFMLPALAQLERKLDMVDIIPESVRHEFDL